MTSVRLSVLFIVSLFFLVCIHSASNAEEFQLSVKGYQATVTKIEGINSSKAKAIGEVRRENAREYCERDPGGETKEYGGKLTKDQCIQKVLKEEKGKRYSSSANCPDKTISISALDGSFTLVGQDWRNNQTGEVLDGSSASGAPVVDAQFRMLCPAPVKKESSGKQDSKCIEILKTHGFLSRAQFQCGYKYYSNDMMQAAKACSQTVGKDELNELLASGMQTFDRNEKERGRAQLCTDVLRKFPKIIRK